MSEEIKTDPRQAALNAFLVNNKDRVEMWMKAHSKARRQLPIVWVEQTQQFVWLNRKQRRGSRT